VPALIKSYGNKILQQGVDEQMIFDRSFTAGELNNFI